MPENRIQRRLLASAHLIHEVAGMLSASVAEAAQVAVACLTGGGKLLACGLGHDADLARWLCSALLLRFERERPSLPAMALGAGLAVPLSPGAGSYPPSDLLACQLRALGQPGDVLVVFAGLSHDDPTLHQVVSDAHARELRVVLLTGGDPGPWPDLLAETDVWIPVANERGAHVRELHLLAVHALCEAIDLLLLGDPEPP